jgi:type IV pilus assembly protein PilE
MQGLRGFTLIELLASLAIAAMLAALATQTYSRYALRSHRAEAQQALVAIAQAQERWYANHHRYAENLGKLGYTASPQGHYSLALSVANAGHSFTATAMPIGRQAGDACGSLSIDSSGRRLPASTDAAANANGRCW